MDLCVICGGYAVEGRQVCGTCEKTKNKELVNAMNKQPWTILTIPGELPDLNQIIKASKSHWGNYSSMKKDNTQAVAHIAKCKRKRFNKANLRITWYCKNKRKDKDNIMAGTKFILDGLVMAKTIPNDGWRHVGDISHVFKVDRDNPRIKVEIWEVV